MLKRVFSMAVALLVVGVPVLCVLATDTDSVGPEVAKKPVFVQDVYPGLASSGLTYARLSELPDGVVLQANGLAITAQEVVEEIGKAPQEVRSQLKNNAFFVLENIATRRLLVLLATAKMPREPEGGAAPPESELIQKYLGAIAAGVQVGDADIAAFYADNEAAFGGVPLEQMKDQIRLYLAQQQQQQIVEEHIRTLGQRMPIAVSSRWTKEQAAMAANNPVDKARRSGKPSLVDFGSTGCAPCDMLAPILEALKKKYASKLNVVFVHIGEEQILAARYGVRTIPTQFFYDKDGKEVFRHVGFWPQAEIEKKLADMGVSE